MQHSLRFPPPVVLPGHEGQGHESHESTANKGIQHAWCIMNFNTSSPLLPVLHWCWHGQSHLRGSCHTCIWPASQLFVGIALYCSPTDFEARMEPVRMHINHSIVVISKFISCVQTKVEWWLYSTNSLHSLDVHASWKYTCVSVLGNTRRNKPAGGPLALLQKEYPLGVSSFLVSGHIKHRSSRNSLVSVRFVRVCSGSVLQYDWLSSN